MDDTGTVTPQSSDGFAAALAAADAGTASSPVQPDTSQVDATAAVQPTETPGVDAPAPEREGFIPRNRFDEVNTRKNQLEQELQAVAWAKQYQPQHIQQVVSFAQQLEADPATTAARLVDHLLSNPAYAQSLVPHLGRWMNARKQQAQAEQEPQPDLVAENGAGVYSAPQLRKWQDWNATRLRAELSGEIQELKADKESRDRADREAKVDREISTAADSIMNELRTYDGFVEHEAEITQIYLANPRMTPHQAYLKWYHTNRLPTLTSQVSKQAESQVLADLKSKASAASVNPGMPSATTPKRYTQDAGGFEAALRDQLAAR